MTEIGIRELKLRASEIVRAVRERRAHYLVTYRGRPVGVLLPLEEPPTAEPPPGESGAAVWDELCALGEAIGREWQSPLTSTELLAELRR